MKVIKAGMMGWVDGKLSAYGWQFHPKGGSTKEMAKAILLYVAKDCRINLTDEVNAESFSLSIERQALDAITIARWKPQEN